MSLIQLTRRLRDPVAAIAVTFAAAAAGCTMPVAEPNPASPAGLTATPAASPSPAAEGQSPVAADALRQYVESLRTDLSRGKVGIINDVMRMDAAESKKFWPLYGDYEEELFALGDRRIELTKRYVAAQSAGGLDDRVAGELSAAWLAFQSDHHELMKKHHAAIGRELSPLRAAQFLQIEHRVATLVDLLIASELPLAEPQARPADRPN